ncbi:hypothetical protein SAMN02745724_04816 [Pseudoalteromonas denitrificans DSM 6059]|uniref:Phage abortive infection protein n=1 Tax=Pseudoalteromonas denitrificans DSM 6059 TaxID=1123010 RepID=A0A1I1TH11_9GAMM|nr:hypothetical protein SAMN02745724_04816 [Pseudoalteromonas denitrificans DSM 6059]
MTGENRNSAKEGVLEKFEIRIMIGLVLTAICVGSFYMFQYNERLNYWPGNRADWGAMGDYVGGMLNPIFSFCTILLLLLSITLQRRELAATREELADTRKVLADTEKSVKQQAKLMEQQTQLNQLQTLTLKQQVEEVRKAEEIKITLDSLQKLDVVFLGLLNKEGIFTDAFDGYTLNSIVYNKDTRKHQLKKVNQNFPNFFINNKEIFMKVYASVTFSFELLLLLLENKCKPIIYRVYLNQAIERYIPLIELNIIMPNKTLKDLLIKLIDRYEQVESNYSTPSDIINLKNALDITQLPMKDRNVKEEVLTS